LAGSGSSLTPIAWVIRFQLPGSVCHHLLTLSVRLSVSSIITITITWVNNTGPTPGRPSVTVHNNGSVRVTLGQLSVNNQYNNNNTNNCPQLPHTINNNNNNWGQITLGHGSMGHCLGWAGFNWPLGHLGLGQWLLGYQWSVQLPHWVHNWVRLAHCPSAQQLLNLGLSTVHYQYSLGWAGPIIIPIIPIRSNNNNNNCPSGPPSLSVWPITMATSACQSGSVWLSVRAVCHWSSGWVWVGSRPFWVNFHRHWVWAGSLGRAHRLGQPSVIGFQQGPGQPPAVIGCPGLSGSGYWSTGSPITPWVNNWVWVHTQ